MPLAAKMAAGGGAATPSGLTLLKKWNLVFQISNFEFSNFEFSNF